MVVSLLCRGGSLARSGGGFPEPSDADLPALNLERLHPGEPDRALSDVIERRRSQAGAGDRRRLQASSLACKQLPCWLAGLSAVAELQAKHTWLFSAFGLKG
jgi:hypothetical protein